MLTLLPSVPVWRDGEYLVFDRKFYDGNTFFANEWHGEMSCVMQVSYETPPVFGLVKKRAEELNFKIILLEQNEKIAYKHIAGSAIVLCSGDTFDQFHVSQICKDKNIKCVYAIEYILETRRQILDMDKLNPLIRLRRHWFLYAGEKKRIKSFALADGIQANGAAAYNEYKHNGKSMIYYDTRMSAESQITDSDLEAKLQSLSSPLRLGFSGRLIKMKGADHLIKLAQILQERGIQYHLTIYGAGDYEDEMKRQIKESNLADNVNMAGVLDFDEELIPTIKKEIDVYVILHRQSDPSCTFLETMSCGIPIVGYDNKAFSGLLEQADIGWSAKMDDINGVADIIEDLNGNLEEVKDKSRKCIAFARLHDFEQTFKRRLEHLNSLIS